MKRHWKHALGAHFMAIVVVAATGLYLSDETSHARGDAPGPTGEPRRHDGTFDREAMPADTLNRHLAFRSFLIDSALRPGSVVDADRRPSRRVAGMENGPLQSQDPGARTEWIGLHTIVAATTALDASCHRTAFDWLSVPYGDEHPAQASTMSALAPASGKTVGHGP